MAGALRKTMVYLGLSEDDPRYQESMETETGWLETDQPDEGADVRDVRHAEVTPITRERGLVHTAPPVTDLRRITTVHPRTYNEAMSIGDGFRAGVPVIMNLTDMTDADAKRLVDFSAGLVFALHGSIERVTNKVFLLSPSHVEVTGETTAPAPVFNQS